ncbi:hypothetical protein [Streptosporangium lutulentum]|uniref:Serine/threonine protein kinase n=1 Tax=Streptosporangium lutulentum TaxID=1461250 RepID=A0ABT9QC34_9ACTN|nr:hypothetical protein [Streptosporangium lutulentum]MDP9844328.1 serine/threonine protein kinase [Streptosporangium lutulentum]
MVGITFRAIDVDTPAYDTYRDRHSVHQVPIPWRGVVHLGESSMGAKFAAKVLRARFADDPGACKRFLREAAAARQVAPFCTERVIAIDMAGDQSYIVSEYVDGVSLSELVRDEGPRNEGGLDGRSVVISG